MTASLFALSQFLEATHAQVFVLGAVCIGVFAWALSRSGDVYDAASRQPLEDDLPPRRGT